MAGCVEVGAAGLGAAAGAWACRHVAERVARVANRRVVRVRVLGGAR